MANEPVVRFNRGQKADLDSVAKVPGQVLFVLNEDDNSGSIYYDESSTLRYRMSYELKDSVNPFTASSTAMITTANRLYPVGIDADGYLAVNVPWINYSLANQSSAGLMSAADKIKLDGIADGAKTGTVTSVATGVGLTGGPITTSGTLKVKLSSETSLSNNAVATDERANRIYPVVPDKSGNLAVVIPWDNTTYSAGTGISFSGTQINNSGIISISVGTNNGTTKINGVDNQNIVAGLKDLAYIAKEENNSTSKFLDGSGSWKSLVAGDIPNLNANKITAGTLPIARGGTGTDAFTLWGIVYNSSSTTLSTTGAGTAGQIFKSNATSAPGWIDQSDINAGTAIKLATARTIQTDLSSTDSASFDGSANITPGVTGYLSVANGGTGRNTLTQGAALVGNGTGAVALRGIKNNTSVGALGWASASSDNTLITTNTLANWNGAYSGTSSNISVVGTITNGIWSASTIAVNKGGTGKVSWIAGEIVYAEDETVLAGTGAGTAGQFLRSGGSSTPVWEDLTANDIPNLNASKITTGTLPIARGGTGGTAFVSYGIVYADGTALTNTAAGTSQYLLQGNGSTAAPSWVNPATLTVANAGKVYTGLSSNKMYVLGTESNVNGYQGPVCNNNIYIEDDVLYGAAWNDYAEYRETKEEIEPGRVIIENGDNTLSLSTKRLQAGAEIVSDTFGFAIGKTNEAKTPIAITGRVLAYPYENIEQFKPGQPVCSGPDGTVSIMSDEEARNYPWLIIGTVSGIPKEEKWKNISTLNRVWIRIR